MKAVIVELRGKYAAALSEDGCVKKLINQNYAVGQTIEITSARKPYAKLALRIASAAAILAVTAIPAYAYYTPYSYVSLDVNPSIEYSLNRFDRVLSCTAVNGDGAELLEHLQLKNKNINEAVELTLSAIADEGYLTADEPGDIVITASSKDEKKSGQLAATLADTAQAAVEEEELDVTVEAEGVGQERVQEAKDLGVTPGKLNLIEKLQESAADDAQIDAEDWLDKPVKEIIKQTRENQKAENNTSTAGQNKNNKDDAPASENAENQEQNQAPHTNMQKDAGGGKGNSSGAKSKK